MLAGGSFGHNILDEAADCSSGGSCMGYYSSLWSHRDTIVRKRRCWSEIWLTAHIFSFFAASAATVYLYHTFFHQIEEDEFGGLWEIVKEGMMTSFALFLVCSLKPLKFSMQKL